MDSPRSIVWPEGKDFAFTVFDDTDNATLENIRPVYSFLEDLGMRTTKSVWPIKAAEEPAIGGITCEDPEYVAWTLDLQAKGFEIGYHGASYTTSTREHVIEAIDRFHAIYGHDPMSMANHTGCAESIYWGADRVTGLNRVGYNLLTGFRRNGVFRGHREGDPLFWGDICRARVRYVRNFTFSGTNTLDPCPYMPYHDPDRPYVNYWFAASEGTNVSTFNTRVATSSIDRLEASGGACLMYTHFASGFWDGRQLNPRFRAQMEQLAARKGWFVPVTTLLDHLATQKTETAITRSQRGRLERRWLRSKVTTGPT